MTYPKFKSKEECAYLDTLDCNGDTPDCKLRCPFMKYDNSKSIFDSSRWRRIYKLEQAHNKEYVQDTEKLKGTDGQ